MHYPVDLTLLHNVHHMPAMPVMERSMNRPDLRLLDFCIPVNSYFPTSDMLADLQRRLSELLRYYPSDNRTVSRLIADLLEIDADHIVASNGSTELITWINERFVTKDLITDVPTFGRWTDNARELGRVTHHYIRDARQQFTLDTDQLVRITRQRGARAMAICNPNNPTGAFLERDTMLELLDQVPDLDVVVIDESFIDFAREDNIPSLAADVADRDNVIVIKSLGKNLGLHGLRCGYAVTNLKMAEQLRGMLPPWNVNSLAEEFVRTVVKHRDAYERSRRQVVRDTRVFAKRLACFDELAPFATHANFVYCQLAKGIDGVQLRDTLLQQFGCYIRECGSKIGSSSQFLRIATRPPAEQQRLINALHAALASVGSPPASWCRRPACKCRQPATHLA